MVANETPTAAAYQTAAAAAKNFTIRSLAADDNLQQAAAVYVSGEAIVRGSTTVADD